jgi:uncharacterized protein (DUF433 family)
MHIRILLCLACVVTALPQEPNYNQPGKHGGKACIRGLRIIVWDVLGWLGAGMTEEQILDEHPDLEKEDFAAVYQFGAEMGRRAGTE